MSDAHVTEPEQELQTARLLNSAAIHLLRAMRPLDIESGLTPARLSALSVLVFGGQTSLGSLARAEAVTSATMTRVVDGLVALGLAKRSPRPDNARMVSVSATPEGEALMRDAAGRRLSSIVEGLTSLPADQRQRIAAAAPALADLSRLLRERNS